MKDPQQRLRDALDAVEAARKEAETSEDMDRLLRAAVADRNDDSARLVNKLGLPKKKGDEPDAA